MIDLQQMIKVQNLKWIKRLMKGIFLPWKATMQTAFGYKYFELIFKSKPRLDDFKFVQKFYFKLLSN